MKPLNDFYIQQAISMMPYVPESTEEVISYFRRNYGLYRYTAWWHHLNEELIDSNPSAKSWISGEVSRLLIHHIRYDNLFHEKLKRDVYLVSYNEHDQIHFYKVLFFFVRKTKVKKRSLLKRMRYLKAIYCTRNKRIIPALWYGLRYITS